MAPPPSDQKTRIGRRDALVATADADTEVRIDALRSRCHDGLVRDASHELKDALNAIVLNAELLAELSSSMDDEAARSRCLEVIRAETRRVDRVSAELCRPVMTGHDADRNGRLSSLLESLAKLTGPRGRRLGVELVIDASDNPEIEQPIIAPLHTAALAVTLHALAASTRNGSVHVSASSDGARASIVVAHDGRAPDCPVNHRDTQAHESPPHSWTRLVHDVLDAHGGAVRIGAAAGAPAEGCRIEIEMPLRTQG